MQAAPLSAMFVALIAVVGPLSGLPCCVHVVPPSPVAIDGADRAVGEAGRAVVDARDAVERLRRAARLRRWGRWRRSGTSGSCRRGADRVAGVRRRAGHRVQRVRRAGRRRAPRRPARGGRDGRAGRADGETRRRRAGTRRRSAPACRCSRPAFQLVPSFVKRTTAAPLATAPTAVHPFAWKHEMPLRRGRRPARLRQPGLAAVRRLEDRAGVAGRVARAGARARDAVHLLRRAAAGLLRPGSCRRSSSAA